MGLIARLQRLTVSRIETFLTSVEDPELLFPQLVKEMEGQVRAATDAAAKAMAAVKAAQREVAEAQGRLDRMQKGAELALNKGDEATAREAVSAQINLEADLKRRQEAQARCQTAQEDAREARKQIQAQLEELRAKKDEILTRARVAKARKRVERTVQGPIGSAKSILDSVAQMESKVEEAEAELDVRREMGKGAGGPSLDKRLQQFEKDEEVEKRLAALQKKMGGATKV